MRKILCFMAILMIAVTVSCKSAGSGAVKYEDDSPYADFFAQVANGNLTQVQAAIETNSDLLKETDSKKNTPLHIAIEYGHTNVAVYLIGQGADLTAENRSKETPMYLALENKQDQVVSSLESYLTDINAEKKGISLLYLSAYNGDTDMVQYLIDQGVDVNHENSSDGKRAVFAACMSGNDEILDLLENNGADLAYDAEFENAPLFAAVYQGDRNLVDRLVEAGADLNVSGDDGSTLYTKARLHDYYTLADHLLALGVSIVPVAEVEFETEEMSKSVTLNCIGTDENYDQAELSADLSAIDILSKMVQACEFSFKQKGKAIDFSIVSKNANTSGKKQKSVDQYTLGNGEILLIKNYSADITVAVPVMESVQSEWKQTVSADNYDKEMIGFYQNALSNVCAQRNEGSTDFSEKGWILLDEMMIDYNEADETLVVQAEFSFYFENE